MRSMRNAGGYVRVFRSMLDWQWYGNDACVRVMLHLLLTVNWEEKVWNGVTIKPGSTLTSMENLSTQLGLSRSTIRRTLQRLTTSGELSLQTNNHWTIITLANWGEYQEVRPTTEPTTEPTKSRPVSRPVNQPVATTKEEKHLRREEEIQVWPADFVEFWSAYPNKKAKGHALKAWEKLTASERTLCLPAIQAQVKAHHFRGRDGQDFTPHPATWLNARRWEDEITERADDPKRPMTKEEAREIINKLREQHGRDFQTHHIPKHVYNAFYGRPAA